MYKTAEVARAVGVSAQTLASWIDRRLIDLGPSPGTGTHRTFSSRDVDRVAIVHELTRVGLSVADAAKAASKFSDERSTKRSRAQLHGDDAKTLLVITQDGASVHRAYDRAEFEDAISKLYAEERTVICLNVGETLRRVDAALSGSRKPMPPAGAVFRNGKQLHIG